MNTNKKTKNSKVNKEIASMENMSNNNPVKDNDNDNDNDNNTKKGKKYLS